jgi:hypothetical protein
VIRAKLLKAVPSLRNIQPQLDLVPESNVPNHPHDIKSPKEFEELGKQVEEVNLFESIAIFHEEEEPLEEVSLSESFAIFHEEEVNLSNSFILFDDNSTYHVPDKSPKDKVFDFSVEPIYYIDFIGIDAILSSYFSQNCVKIYMVKKAFLSKIERVFVSSLGIFMACGKNKAQEKHDKSTQKRGVWGFHDKHRGTSMMRNVALILGCSLVLILRNGEWNELTEHSKDRGKDRSNSGRILSNLGRMM